MRTATFMLSAATAGLAAAQNGPSAIVNVEASHGGAGSGLTNNTILVPIGSVYNNAAALAEVSTLYLTGVKGITDEPVPNDIVLNDIVCTPYGATNGTGTHGFPFVYLRPSLLSTNTVVVGSIICQDLSEGIEGLCN